MGNCVSQKQNRRRSHDLQQLPTDIQNYNPRFNTNLERLAFQCELGNVKIAGIPVNQEKSLKISIKFSVVPDIIDIYFPVKNLEVGTTQIKWRTKGTFAIKGNEYDIRKHFLQISTYNVIDNLSLTSQSMDEEKEKKIGFLKINLYHIMSGPSHNDFQIKIDNKTTARIIFDLKISQIVEIKLKSTRTFIQFMDAYPNENFNFTIKAKVDSQQSSQSKQINKNPVSAPSYVASIPLVSQISFKDIHQLQNENDLRSPSLITARQSTQNQNRAMSSPLKRKMNRKVSKMVPIEQPSTVEWKRQQCDQMPSFKIKMKSCQISTTVFEVTVWKVVSKQKNIEIQKFGEWIIPLVTLLQFNSQKIRHSNSQLQNDKILQNLQLVKQPSFNRKNSQLIPQVKITKGVSLRQTNQNLATTSKFITKDSRIEGQIYNADQRIGAFQMEFEISNTKYITQKHACSRTQDGIMNMSNIETYGLSKIKNDNFSKLCKCYDEIVTKQKSINANQSKKSNRSFNKYASMKGYLNKFLNILQETRKGSLVYCSQDQLQEMLFRQDTLLNMANQVKQLIEDNENILANLCWQIQAQIFKRGQLLLSNIGFRQNHQLSIQNQQISDLLKKKIKIALKYQQIIYVLLKKALSGASFYYNKGGSGNFQEEDYRQVFKVNSFLAVPIFRQRLLKQITKYNGQDVEEANGNSTQLQERYKKASKKMNVSSFTQQQQSLLITLEYEQHFYKWIRQYPQSKVLNEQLQQMLSQDDQIRIKIIANKKNGAFYTFVKTLMNQLETCYKFHQIPQYQYVPGYNKIVGSILKAMNDTSLLLYNPNLVSAATSLLLNPFLINSYLTIIFEKTNLHCQDQVCKTLDLVQKFLQQLTKNQKCLFKDFPHLYLLRAIRPILECQSVILAAKALVLLYTFFPKFNSQFQKSLSMYLMGKIFFRMFYNWSGQIRYVFHSLLIVRIAQCQELHQIPQFTQRYEAILRIIVNAQSVRTKQQWKEKSKRRKQALYYLKLKSKIKDLKKPKTMDDTKKVQYKKQMTQLVIPRYSETQKKASERTSQYLSVEPTQMHVRSRRLSQDYDLAELKRQTTDELKIANLRKNVQEHPEQMIIKLRSKPSFFETNNFVDITQVKQVVFQNDQFSNGIRQNDEQYELKELLENQLAYILPATNQFRQLNRMIQKIFNERGVSEVDLENQVYYDHKEIRP